MIRVAINGYGRIGRVAHRVILERFSDQVEVVAINGGNSTDIQGWAFLLKYDTSYGILKNHTVHGEEGKLVVDGRDIKFFAIKDPSALPWRDLQIDVVIECTGQFTTAEKIKPHLDAGAKKVVLSAPARDSTIRTFVVDVNLTQEPTDQVISNASCTTNCIAPVAQIMVAKFGVLKAMMTTIHAYTTDQRLQDGGHKDYRRARAAAANIIPTSTGATIAAAEAVPELKGLFEGSSIRVPIVVGSLSDFTFHLKRSTTAEEINNVLKEAAQSARYKDVLEVSEDPLVSSDIIGNPHSAIVDLPLTQVAGGDLAKIFAWYDNEWGYANRLIEEVVLVGQ